MKEFFKSMAACWLLCILIAVGMLFFTDNDSTDVYPDSRNPMSESSLSYIVLKMRMQVQAAPDLHEFFVAIISGILNV